MNLVTLQRHRTLRTLVTLTLALSLYATATGCSGGGGGGGKGFEIYGVNVGNVAGAGKALLVDSQVEYSAEDQNFIGRGISAQVIAKYPVLKDDAATRYVAQIGQALAAVSSLPDTYDGYHFLIVDSEEINAFSAPGGYIMVAKGVIKCCTREDQLAAVIAHEVAHVQDNHGINAVKQSSQSGAFTALALEAGKGALHGNAIGSTALNAFGDMSQKMASDLITHNYSRELESQADADGVVLMQRIGYDGHGMTEILTNMKAKLANPSGGLMATHPGLDERIATVNKQLGTAPAQANDAARQARFNAALAGILKK